jgi:hypothetical protein
MNEETNMTGYDSMMALIESGKSERTIAEMVYTLVYDGVLTQEQMVDIFQEFASMHYMNGLEMGNPGKPVRFMVKS